MNDQKIKNLIRKKQAAIANKRKLIGGCEGCSECWGGYAEIKSLEEQIKVLKDKRLALKKKRSQ